ncbi:DNRLRE domain-containing protein [Streptomyces katrae]|uniref:DNRLRE domain-containing protein n=1 Tax=Streptomyces katrae TaxID=68223 RepID=A0ABT7GNT0_9ACTN|nr:DNRLRE domain-containing protein [Streptomyces katrae]MDK9495228.1 DNRLRE domain-containing protein [Streptomyces katrae]
MPASDPEDDSPPTALTENAHVGEPSPRWYRRRRAIGGLAGLLALTIALPIALQQDARKTPAAEPPVKSGASVTAPEARRLAKESGKEVEVTAEATSYTTTWAQPSGTFKLQVSSLATRAKVGNQWKPIDTTLERVEGGFAPKAVNGRVVFSAGSNQQPAGGGSGERASRGISRVVLARPAALKADGPNPAWSELVRLTTGGHDLIVAWPGPLPEPVISGPRALYENVRPGIDLVMTAQDGGYTHVLVVKDKKAATDPLLGQLNYRLSSPDLTFHMDETSRAVSAKDSKGEEVAGSPTPYMWDSAGKVAVTEGEPQAKPAPEAKDHPTLALSGLNGAEGNHAKVAGATLSAENVLTVTPNSQLLNDADTVYPVFIDPSFKGHTQNWVTFYKTEGNSSFWNGQNYNSGSGTPEARVGYESTSGGTSRAAFIFDFGTLIHGAQIRSANLRLLQTYSWGCDPRAFDVYHTPLITSSSTWNNTNNGTFWGNRIAGATTGHGYNSSCPDDWVAIDIKSKVEEGARGAWQNLTLGLRSPNESDPSYWKKFYASGESAPLIVVEYNRVPDTPVLANMSTSPGGGCVTGQPYTKIGKTDVDFRAKGTDGDGNLRRLSFRIWSADGAPVADELRDTNGDGVANVTVPWEKFTPGKTYFWLAQAIDWDGQWSGSGPMDSGGGGWCTFTVDHTQPTPPTIRSEDFPAPGPDGAEWSKNTLGPGKITVIAGGTNPADIREFQWSLNHPVYDQKAVPAAGSDTVTVDVNPDNAGPNLFYVRIVNKAGNLSNPVTYTFYVRPRPGLDGPGDTTGDGKSDLLAIDGAGDLRVYPADQIGDVDAWMPAATDNGKPAPAGYWKDASGKSALVAHSQDWYPGDGITDLIARMPDGKLYVYQGDGNGRFDISRRMEVLLPAGAPDPATFSQVVVVPDMNGDKMEDIFATAGDTFWILTGYSGATITEARQLSATSWTKRDIIDVRDITGDGVPDLLFRDDTTPDRGLALRRGKPGPNGGADINSLALAVNSADGKDLTYATTGWDSTTWPLLHGTPDVNNDGIPDFYATRNDGTLHLINGGRATATGSWRVEEDDWATARAIG